MSSDMGKRPLIMGTAGHIDHGKSTLVQALTGTDPDRLAEEKRRGITIELGFAQLELPSGRHIGVVDVPGHERFVRQMIAGATGIDMALLCIAADDGIMPQTREHLAVLDILGIPRLVVALTKCDAVDSEWVALVQNEVQAWLANTRFAKAPVIPVSAKTKTGLDTLLDELESCANSLRNTDETGPVRLPVDRVFTIKGAGTVITGSLWQGNIAEGDELEVLPSHKRSRVRSIQNHGVAVSSIGAGNRTALNLADLSTEEISAGDFLATPGTLQTSDRFDARVTYLPTESDEKPLASGTRVHISHGTREVTGRLLLMNGQELLAPRETAYAQIRLDAPLPASHGDRFVLRSYSPVHVIGGGVVLNSQPRHRTNLSAQDQAVLEALGQDDVQEQCRAIVASATTPISANDIAGITGLDPKQVCAMFQEHAPEEIVQLPTTNEVFFATKQVVQKSVDTLENTLIAFHAENPAATGVAKMELAARMPHYLDPACFDAILEQVLTSGKIVLNKGELCHPKAGARAVAAERENADALLAVLQSAGLTPPPLPKAIADAGLDARAGAKAIQALEANGSAQRITKELAFTRVALDELWGKARAYLEENGQGSAAELKEAMGTSRKYAIPLLEYFDSARLTQRKGDTRVLPH